MHTYMYVFKCIGLVIFLFFFTTPTVVLAGLNSIRLRLINDTGSVSATVIMILVNVLIVDVGQYNTYQYNFTFTCNIIACYVQCVCIHLHISLLF